MRLDFASLVVSPLLFARHASATFRRGTGLQLGPYDKPANLLDLGVNGTNGWGTFDQLLDHSDPDLGTFEQRFWYGTEYWKGPGSPIILVNPGEQPADGFNDTYLTTQRLTGLFAKEVGGAVVVLEHRYWGGSSPYEELTVENLKYLTLENSILDNTYFAENFLPPFDRSGKSSPDKAPWVFSGGSYSGALAGWIAALQPDVFWAYHGTSGVVQALSDFWQYFEPVMEATPLNCTRDLELAIDHIDAVLLNGTASDKQKLKDRFLLGDLEDADFATALEEGPWTWQATQFYSEERDGFNHYHQFCDYIENVWPNSTSPVPGEEGVGQTKALDGYAKWMRELLIPGYCEFFGYDDWQGTYNTGCFANLNESSVAYSDLSVDNPMNRQWNWMLCNDPFEWWQDGAPENRPTIVSRLVTPEYWTSQCALFFPEGGYGLDEGKTAEDVNEYTGGWFVTNTTRLMYANGELDPWRDVTVSSIFRPGGPLESTPELPVRVIREGTHCSDFYGQNWEVNDHVKSIAYEEAANIKEWVLEFYEQ